MALVNDGTMSEIDDPDHGRDPDQRSGPAADPPDKRLFLVVTFRGEGGQPADGAPVTGTADQVVAVVGMEGDHQRFEWVGGDRSDAVARPALVTPVLVRAGLPSPWHPPQEQMMTGLVQLAPEQLGDGTVDDDMSHLLEALAAARPRRPARRDEVS